MADKEVSERLFENLKSVSFRVEDASKRKEAIFKFIRKQTPDNTARLLLEIAEQSMELEASTGLFCVLLNMKDFSDHLGRKQIKELKTVMQTSVQMNDVFVALNGLRDFNVDEVMILQAQFSIYLQINLLLDFRLAEKGYPTINRSLLDILDLATRDPDDQEMRVLVHKSDYPDSSWGLLENILEEADFISGGDGVYELSLSETTVTRLASGQSISGSKDSKAVSSRMSDRMLIRQAENLIKRLSLVIRGATMYPSGHPGLPPLLQSCMSVLANLLSGRDMVVLTHLGGEIMVNDIRIRKQTRFLREFINGMEERNMSSLTFSKGITLEEIEDLGTIFVQGIAWLKDQGGARLYLASKGVVHIAVDMYHYGIIDGEGKVLSGGSGAGTGSGSGEGTGAGDGGAGESAIDNVSVGGTVDGVAAENGQGTGVSTGVKTQGGSTRTINTELLLLNEIVAKVSGGEGLQTISSDEIGRLFKKILSGDIERDEPMRKTLAELIVTLDPGFLEHAIIEQPEIRERLSWVVIRRIIERTLKKLESESLKIRLSALEILNQIGELAVVRSKNSSIRQILTALTDRFLVKEDEEDTLFRLSDVTAKLIGKLIEHNSLIMARSALRVFRLTYDNYDQIQPSPQIEIRKVALDRMFMRISRARTVQFLIKQIEVRSRAHAERSLDIILTLRTEEIVNQLLKVFETGSRRVRGRAYSALIKMPEISGEIMAWRMESLNDKELFPRQESNPDLLMDESWYRARNALGVLAEIWHGDAPRIFYDASQDPDPRIRKEILNVLLHANRDTVGVIARGLLRDTDSDVRSYAILALRTPEGKEAVADLIRIFIEEPRLRSQVIETLSGIGSERAQTFILDSLRLKDSHSKQVFFKDPDLYQTAIRSMVRFGSEREIEELDRVRRQLKNPFMYLFHFPMSWIFKARGISATIKESQYRLREHIKEQNEEDALPDGGIVPPLRDEDTPELTQPALPL
jgi:hypothetical protein